MLKSLKWTVARHPLRSPAFLRLWLGLSISYVGDQFTTIALLWFVLQLTGSGVAISLVLLCFFSSLQLAFRASRRACRENELVEWFCAHFSYQGAAFAHELISGVLFLIWPSGSNVASAKEDLPALNRCRAQ
jgi:hypothetical protein